MFWQCIYFIFYFNNHFYYLCVLKINCVKKEICTYLKWFFPLLFAGYITCISLFEHAHIVDGVIIVHSHATQGGNAVPHQHSSKFELFQFHYLSHFNAGDSVVGVLSIRFIPSYLSDLEVSSLSLGFPVEANGILFLRAPPVV